MLRITFAVLAVALASTAGAAGWRKLQLDASSEAAFEESVATFQEKLSPSRRVAFARSLQDIWGEGTQRASAQQREYTIADYLRQLHGLGYNEVMTLADPTDKAEGRYRAAYYASRSSAGPVGVSRPYPSCCSGPLPVDGGQYRGANTLRGPTGGL